MYVCAFAHARVHVYVCAHACVYVDVECTQDQESSLSFVVYHSIILFSLLRILLRTQNLIKVEENRKEWGRTMAPYSQTFRCYICMSYYMVTHS